MGRFYVEGPTVMEAGETYPQCQMDDVTECSCKDVARAASEKDAAVLALRLNELERRADWAMGKLRDMNHRSKRWGRAWMNGSSRSAKKPTSPLRVKDPDSVMEWLRYLLHCRRSHHGEVVVHGRCLRARQIEAVTPR